MLLYNSLLYLRVWREGFGGLHLRSVVQFYNLARTPLTLQMGSLEPSSLILGE